MSMCRVFSCVVGRGCLIWPVHFLGKTLSSLCPASFCIPRPNLPVTPGVSWLPTFVFQSPIMKRSSIQWTKIRPGADCDSDHELLITKFILKLKKVGKTARPFRYDLNQIPYDYTVEVRNRFKGLDLIDRVPDELRNEVRDIVQETGIKTIPMEKKWKKQSGCLETLYK